MLAYLEGRELYVLNCNVGADDEHRLPIRVITEFAWQSLFSNYMFRPILDPAELSAHVPDFTVICAPGFHSRPEMDGTRSEVFILIHFGRKEVIIGAPSTRERSRSRSSP
jgi:phosphoenolpyruvate carboxykinase (ATP)